MKSSKETRNDALLLQNSEIRYAVDQRTAWSFPISELWLIAEWTDDHGPADDYFYYFVAGRPARIFEAPMYANPRLIEEISVSLGTALSMGLANRTDFASRIMWPPELEGRPLFDYSPAIRDGGLWNRVKDRLFPLIRSEFTGEVLQYVKSRTG